MFSFVDIHAKPRASCLGYKKGDGVVWVLLLEPKLFVTPRLLTCSAADHQSNSIFLQIKVTKDNAGFSR